jgi:ketosteroid isomerase-like protein
VKKLIWISVFAVALSAATIDPKGDKEVLAAMDAFKEAMTHKDGAALGKLLADDLTYVHSAGQVQTKAEVIQSIVSGKTIVERMDYSDTSVRFYGKTALVRGRVDLYHSSTTIVHMNVLHVWIRSPQGWQMVARQATRLEK